MELMRLLVVGANGLLGSNVVTVARNRDWDVVGTYHSHAPAFDIPLEQLDITNTDRVRDVIREHDPDWVINCAAMTDVDDCEINPERANEINARAPGKIAEICAHESTRFLHVSTDYVFDGQQTGTYTESSTPNPVQEYGISKLAGERAVREVSADALIARLSFVYGIHRSTNELTGFPAWVRDRLTAGKETPLFTDQQITPTRAGQAAATFLDLIENKQTGEYHVATQSCVTPYQFGVEICEQMNADSSLLSAGSRDDVERDADRPACTCLDVSRVETALGRSQPTIEEELDAIASAVNS